MAKKESAKEVSAPDPTDFKSTVEALIRSHLLFGPDTNRAWTEFKSAVKNRLGAAECEVVRRDDQTRPGGGRYDFEIVCKLWEGEGEGRKLVEKRLAVGIRQGKVIT